MRRRIQEQLADRAVEAVRDVIDYYQRWFMSLDVAGQSRPAEKVRQFQQVRQLRDVLTDVVDRGGCEFELDRAAENLLVSCCVFSMESIAELTRQSGLQSDEQEHLALSLRELYGVAIEFASDPVRPIERGDRAFTFPVDVRRMVEAINVKAETGEVRPMPTLSVQGRGDGQAPERGLKLLSDKDFFAQWSEDTGRNLLPTGTGPASGTLRVPGLETGACIQFGSFGRDDSDGMSIRHGSGTFGPGDCESGVLDAVGSSRAFGALHLREPRLRTLAEHATAALDAAIVEQDHTLAAVLLSSILEAAIVDIALARRHELRLRGTPDSWDLQHLMEAAGHRSMDLDRETLAHVLACRDLMRPAIQLMRPYEVDAEMLSRMTGAVRRFLVGAGYAAERSAR